MGSAWLVWPMVLIWPPRVVVVGYHLAVQMGQSGGSPTLCGKRGLVQLQASPCDRNGFDLAPILLQEEGVVALGQFFSHREEGRVVVQSWIPWLCGPYLAHGLDVEHS